MKKVLMFSVSALFVLGLASCKKDYTCTCTISGTSTSTEILDSKKGDAEDACNALEVAARIGDPNASCNLD